ncbi:winged helix-turn-helix transcriptional regulator [Croceibacterium ferulae]|uniref:winged helix-turn-helix transcriptional regulator n=1 Tax=Croceibacterium ferulae TaxID=1854641 RepID=UPI000EB3C4A9|nr:helix-turn-helix domain-containing protein [Croceibacterium ferulae]
MATQTIIAQEGTFLSEGHTDVPAPLQVPDHGACTAVNDVLARVGDKWTIRVIMALGTGPLRFNALKREIDAISQRMLTRTLRVLERDGLVRRLVEPSVPPRVEYSLTPLGRSLQEPVTVIGQWAMDKRGEVARARADYDARDEG